MMLKIESEVCEITGIDGIIQESGASWTPRLDV